MPYLERDTCKLAICGGQKVKSKPFPAWPQWDASDESAMLDALRLGRWSRVSLARQSPQGNNDGYLERLEQAFAQRHAARYALAVASGTAALDMAVSCVDIQRGDEVVVSPYSFISSATCILHAGAVPVFVDICPDTWNLNVHDIPDHLTDKTRAIIAVHFAGQPCEMDTLCTLAERHGLSVIEDAAQAVNASWCGRPIGSMGDIGCFSLQGSKNLTCGEGGVVVTNSEDHYHKLYALHTLGRAFGSPWYTHSELGWNYRLTELQAAVACAQLRRFDVQRATRAANAAYLTEFLSGMEGILVKHLDPRATNPIFHLFAFRFQRDAWPGLSRRRFVVALNAEGIPCTEGYSHPIYRNPLFGFSEDVSSAYADRCHVAEQICREAVWLPQNLLLGDRHDMEEIAGAITKIRLHLQELVR